MISELRQFRQSVSGMDFKLSDNIIIHHPTLGEISDFGEEKYYSMATSLCGNASSLKVGLWDILGIDWTQISDWDFFKIVSRSLPREQTQILLGELDLSELQLAISKQTGDSVLIKEDDKGVSLAIDRALHAEMIGYIRHMHRFEFKVDLPADEQTKRYMLEKERRRIERQKNKIKKSMLKPLVSGMVNTAGFKYDYTTVWDLPISAFNDSVNRVQKYLRYMQTMQGVYSGGIDIKGIDPDDLDWLS